MKYSEVGLYIGFEQAEERTSNLECKWIESILSEEQKENTENKMNRAWDTCGTPSNRPTYMKWVLEGERRDKEENYWRNNGQKFYIKQSYPSKGNWNKDISG